MTVPTVESYQALTSEYFARPTLEVARDLIGQLVVRCEDEGTCLVGRIVETEAYTEDDPACHAWNLREAETGAWDPEGRGAELFGPPGLGYVYLCYGVHWLLNVVTEPEGTCGAVLIRAVEPLDGIGRMRERRSAARRDIDLTNGPGKLTEALAVDDRFHGEMLTGPPLFFAHAPADRDWPTAKSPRIGIQKATEREWRFFIRDNGFVSSG